MKFKFLKIATLVSAPFIPLKLFAIGLPANTYLGMDAGVMNYALDNNFGGNVFKENHPRINLFAGYKLTDYVGVELGIDHSMSKKNTTQLKDGESNLGSPVSPGAGPISVASKSKLRGVHLSLVGNYPINDSGLSLSGGIGLKLANAKYFSEVTETRFGPQNPTDKFSSSRTKPILKLSAGVQYFINEHFGVRCLAHWENTSRIKHSGLTSFGNSRDIRHKNSLGYSLGFIIK